MKCEGDWRETERSVAATAGHVDRREGVCSCGVCCEEGRSNRLTATVGGCSEMALCFLSGLSVCLYPQKTNKKYSKRRRPRRQASCHNILSVAATRDSGATWGKVAWSVKLYTFSVTCVKQQIFFEMCVNKLAVLVYLQALSIQRPLKESRLTYVWTC